MYYRSYCLKTSLNTNVKMNGYEWLRNFAIFLRNFAKFLRFFAKFLSHS